MLTVLLNQWLRRFLLEGDPLWSKVIRSSYGVDSDGWDTKSTMSAASRSRGKEL